VTLIEAVQDIYEGLGEPSDLRYGPRGNTLVVDLVDPTLAAHWQRLVEVVNRAQNKIATWKFPNGRQLRFKKSSSKTLFRSQIAIETLSGTLADYFVSGTIVGTYNSTDSWVLDINGELFQVIDQGAGTLTLDRPLTSTFVNSTGTLRRRRYYWSPVAPGTVGSIGYSVNGGIPNSVHSIETDSGTSIELVSKLPFTLSVADPTQAFCTSDAIEFAEAPDTVQTFLVHYASGPVNFGVTLAEQTQQLWLPGQYHEAIVLWGLWWGYRRAQENSSAYSTKRDLDDFLARVRSESDYDDEFRTVQMSYSME